MYSNPFSNSLSSCFDTYTPDEQEVLRLTIYVEAIIEIASLRYLTTITSDSQQKNLKLGVNNITCSIRGGFK